jgi:hypothetical protein
VRYTWTVNPEPAEVGADWEKTANPHGEKVVAKWQQAFSTANGKT